MHTDTGPKVEFVGEHAENTIRLLASIDSKVRPEYDRLKFWAAKFGLPSIDAGIDQQRIKIAFKDERNGSNLDLNDAASGSRQGLILAAQFLLSPKGATLLIEEPENNLHPAFEKLLPELFAEAVGSGRQVVISTHSEVLVAALGNAVRKKLLAADQAAVWHLERGEKGIDATPIQISERGALHGWVKSFAAVDEDLFNDWAKDLPEEGRAAGRGRRTVERRRPGRKKLAKR
jgi:hypothetical protein